MFSQACVIPSVHRWGCLWVWRCLWVQGYASGPWRLYTWLYTPPDTPRHAQTPQTPPDTPWKHTSWNLPIHIHWTHTPPPGTPGHSGQQAGSTHPAEMHSSYECRIDVIYFSQFYPSWGWKNSNLWNGNKTKLSRVSGWVGKWPVGGKARIRECFAEKTVLFLRI